MEEKAEKRKEDLNIRQLDLVHLPRVATPWPSAMQAVQNALDLHVLPQSVGFPI